jgi:hypothetical protein
MKIGRRKVAVYAMLACGCAGLGACAYGVQDAPSESSKLVADAAGGRPSQGAGGGGPVPAVTTGSGGGAGDFVADPGGGAGSSVVDEAGASDAADEGIASGTEASDLPAVDAGPRDTGARDIEVIDVSKPPLLFDPGKLYFIKPKNGSPGIAMDVDLDSQSNGARVKQWTFSATDNAEQFAILDNGNNTWRIAMKDNRNQCVDNPANQVVDSTKLQMWQCLNNDIWQQWVITPDPSGASTFQLKNVGSNLYLDQPGSSTNIDLTLQVYTQNGTNAQKWIITPTM